MSVLIYFLLQNTNLVSALSKIWKKNCWSCLTGMTNFMNSVNQSEIDLGLSSQKKKWECLWQCCFLYNQNEMRNIRRGSSKHHSRQVWFNWPSSFKGEDWNMKSLLSLKMMDTQWWQMITWPFGSSELKFALFGV